MDITTVAEALAFIRRAVAEDNQELLNLEKMCAQGTGLVLLFDRSPDFFRRSQVYEDFKVYVAEVNGKIIGTIASTGKEFSLSGKKAKGIYIYDLRVNPDHRGKGIGSSLIHKALEGADDADLAYGIIMEENNPSIALFEKMGFRNIHDPVLFNIPLYARKEQATPKVRVMTLDDVSDVVNLLNDHYRNRDFSSPISQTGFQKQAERLPGYGLQRIQVIEDERRIAACAGVWDYSEIFRISVLHMSTKLRMLTYFLRFINIFKKTMRLPSVGEPFRLMYVRDFAFAEKTDVAKELIEHCLSLAYSNGCSFLSFVLDPADPAIHLLTEYKPIKITYHLYAKSLKEEDLTSSNMVHIDSADL